METLELNKRYYDNLDEDYFTVAKIKGDTVYLKYEGECLYSVDADGYAAFDVSYMAKEIANGTVVEKD